MSRNHNNFPNASGDAQVFPQGADMSEAFYSRNCIDPLMVAFPDPQLREQIVQYSEAAGKYGNTAEAINFSLDALYRSLPLETAVETNERIHKSRSLIERKLGGRIPEDERLGLRMHEIDLNGLQIFRSYHAANKSSDPAVKQSASNILEATCIKQIRDGAKLLKETLGIYDKMTDENARKDLRGKMFELLFITDQRRRLYSDEQHDEKVLVAATDFEDKPSIFFTPNHNYDAISFDSRGETVDVFQCKNARTVKNMLKQQFSPPIRLVRGQAFDRFIDEPDKYIIALSILSSNSPNVTEQTMVSCRALMEGLFVERPEVANQAGRMALR